MILFRPPKNPERDLFPYYQMIRGAISGFDGIIGDHLMKGATAIVAIAAGPMAVFKAEPVIAFWTSLFALPVALYLLTVIDLYSELLRRSVSIAIGLEESLFKTGPDRALWLTTNLERHPLAGGRLGPQFYMLFVRGLYLAALAFSSLYFFASGYRVEWIGLLWFVAAISLLARGPLVQHLVKRHPTWRERLPAAGSIAHV